MFTIDAQSICLFLLVVADIHTEEDDWSDEFDDSAEEATPGCCFFYFHLIYFKLATCKYPLKQQFQNLLLNIYLC